MKNIVSLANDFIVKYGIRSAPLKFEGLRAICAKLGYDLYSFSEGKEIMMALGIFDITKYIAFTYRSKDNNFVFFDETCSTGTRHFAIAHEIGHIALKHNYVGAIGYTKADNVQEREANTFAYQLLAPLCVLDALNVSSIRDIENTTLLDFRRALHIKTKLLFYKPSPADDKVLKVNGTRRALRKSKVTSLLLPLTLSALIAYALATHFNSKPQLHESDASTSTFTTTIDVLSHLKQKTVPEISALPEDDISSHSPNESENVYITPSGNRYHKVSCYHLKNSNSYSAVALATATADGYTPCKTCFK